MNDEAYYIKGLLRQPNASLARKYLGITGGGGNGIALSAGAASVSAGTVVFSNSNNVTFGLNGSTITASAGAGGGGSINFSASNTSANLASVTFSNSNGISFGLNAGVITAQHNALTSQSNQAFSASGGSSSFQTLSFNNANGVTFSNNAGAVEADIPAAGIALGGSWNFDSTTTAADPGSKKFRLNNGTLSSVTAIYISDTSYEGTDTSTILSFITAGMRIYIQQADDASRAVLFEVSAAPTDNTGWWTIPVTVVSSATIMQNGKRCAFLVTTLPRNAQAYAVSNTTQATSGVIALSALSFQGNGIVSAGISNGSVVLSATQSNQAASASNGSFTFQTINFSNANNVTFGTSAGSIITASVAAGGGLTNINVSAGTTSQNLSNLAFSNNGNVSFGMAGSTISANAPAAQINFSAGTTSSNLNSVVFSNSNGISFGLNSSTITASHNGLLTQSNQAVSAANGSFTFQTLSFANSNGVSFSTGTQGIFASVGAAGGDAIRGIAAGASTATTNTVNFSNANGVSFGFGAAGNSTVITASHNALTSIAFSADVSSTFQTLTFQNSNNISFSNNAGAIRVTHNLAGTSTAITGGASITLNSSGLNFNGTALAGTGTTFAGANISGSITQNTAGLNLSLSVAAPGGAGAARSHFQWPEINANSTAVQVSGSSKHVQPFRLPFDLSVSYLRMPLTLSCVGSNAATGTAVNQTVGATISSTFQLAFYSLGVGANSRVLQSYFTTQHTWVQQLTIQAAGVGSNWSSGHTISYPMSSSASAAFTVSGAATSASRTMNSSVISDFTNLRFLDLLMNTSFSAGVWFMAFNSSTSLATVVSNFLSTQRILASNIAVSQPAQSINLMGAATNSSNLYQQGLGSWSTNSIGTTTGSISMANISRVASNPVLNFEMIRQA